MQLRSQVDDQAKIIGRLQEAQDLLVNEMAKMKEVLASLQQSSQSRSSSSPPVSALHSTSQILSPNSTTSSLLSPNSTTSLLLSPNSTTTLLSPNSTSPSPGQLQSGVPQTLLPVQEVLDRNKNLVHVSLAGKLSIKLAKEAFFGEEVMRQCTPLGMRGLPALPKEELAHLKTTLIGLFPAYRRNPAEFEEVWECCIVSIQQACKCLRYNF